MRTLALILAALLAALTLACGGDDDDSSGAGPAASTSSGALSNAQVADLRKRVQEDLDKHGRALGCAWRTDKLGEQLNSKALELAGAPGELADPWGAGFVGLANKVQIATFYDARSGAKDTKLVQKDGEGFTCFVSE